MNWTTSKALATARAAAVLPALATLAVFVALFVASEKTTIADGRTVEGTWFVQVTPRNCDQPRPVGGLREGAAVRNAMLAVALAGQGSRSRDTSRAESDVTPASRPSAPPGTARTCRSNVLLARGALAIDICRHSFGRRSSSIVVYCPARYAYGAAGCSVRTAKSSL